MTPRSTLARALATAILLLLPATTNAQEPSGAFAPAAQPGGGFGSVGQWVLSGEANVAFHKQSGGGWQLRLQPALDVFVMPSFSVGGVVTIFHAEGGDTTIALGGRVGYNLNITEHVGWWPLGGLNFGHTSNSMQHTSSTNASAHIFAPFLYHIVPHFFAGLGPSFDLGISDSHKDFGIDSIVGGWF